MKGWWRGIYVPTAEWLGVHPDEETRAALELKFEPPPVAEVRTINRRANARQEGRG
jgi:hypothetical protein